MTALRAIIVDDEPLARRRLRTLLAQHGDVEIVAECEDGPAAVSAIQRQRPDVVLLDIQMPGLDGFQVLERLPPGRRPAIVFVTAHDEHAVRAFEASATDYLLKPIRAERLEAALDRVRQRGGDAARLSQQFDVLLKQIAARSAGPPPFFVRDGARWTVVPAADVEWIEAAGKYVRLHCGKHAHLLRESIGRLAERLAGQGFVRIHRSTMVNLDRILQLEPAFHGDMVVTLRGGAALTLSRAYRDEVRRRLGGGL